MSNEYPPLRQHASLLDAYLRYLESPVNPFMVPGHKGRSGFLDEGLGLVNAGDVPLYGGLDTIKQTRREFARAQERAASLYGADWARFSTGGSTHANQALCLAVGRPGDTVIITRSLHRSTLLGLVLAGLLPHWLPPRLDPATGIPVGTLVSDVADALRAAPHAVAVMLTEPGYLGTIGERAEVIKLAHDAGMPVIVDQAWGAHLGFDPSVPPHALALGADALVTSIHKLLPGYSQASLVVARTERLDSTRLDRGFDATHTTSPAGSILASIDGALALMAHRPDLIRRTVDTVRWIRESLRQAVPGLYLPDETTFGRNRYDPLRLIVSLAPAGADGIRVEQRMIDDGFPIEMADRDTLIPIVTVADDQACVEPMVRALADAINHERGTPRPQNGAVSWRVNADTVVDPRRAFFAPHHPVPAEHAIGRISAELISPYPPGVPVLAPGERISAQLLEDLLAAAASGTRIAYANDPLLATIDVLDEDFEQ